MNQPAYIEDDYYRVKEFLAVWSEWMQRPTESLGYGRTVGFESGGSVSGWEDFERQVEKNMAINTQAILEGLPLNQQHAVFHFHVAAVITPNRTNIEDDYQDALMALEIALRRRGLL